MSNDSNMCDNEIGNILWDIRYLVGFGRHPVRNSNLTVHRLLQGAWDHMPYLYRAYLVGFNGISTCVTFVISEEYESHIRVGTDLLQYAPMCHKLLA